jgi:hypothetical protein
MRRIFLRRSTLTRVDSALLSAIETVAIDTCARLAMSASLGAEGGCVRRKETFRIEILIVPPQEGQTGSSVSIASLRGTGWLPENNTK